MTESYWAHGFLSLKSVLLLALILRIGVFGCAWWKAQDYSVFYSRDSATYLQPATELLNNGTFTSDDDPELMRTPGYPVLLALGLSFGRVELLTILLQIILSCFTCYLVYSVAHLVCVDKRPAIWAALLYSLEPLSILYSCQLLSDTLFVFLITAALYWLLRFLQQKHLWAGGISAVAMAAATYTRPISYFLPIWLASVLFVWAIIKKDRMLRLHIAIFCLVTMSLVGLWQVRNKLVTGYAGFSTMPEIVLYFYHAGAVKARQQEVPFYQMVEQLGYYNPDIYFQQHPEQQSWTPVQRYSYLRSEGLKLLAQSPMLYGQIYVKGLVITMLDPGVTEYLRLFRQYPKAGRLLNTMSSEGLFVALGKGLAQTPMMGVWGALLGMMLLGFYLLTLFGLRSQFLQQTPERLILLSTCFYFMAISGGIIAVGRFRLPLMPVLSVFAGYGLQVLMARVKVKKSGLSESAKS